MAASIETNLAFANRRDEAIHQIKEQMKGFIQKTEMFQKELEALDQQRDEVIGTLEVLQAAITGLQRVLADATSKDIPDDREFPDRANKAAMATRAQKWQ